MTGLDRGGSGSGTVPSIPDASPGLGERAVSGAAHPWGATHGSSVLPPTALREASGTSASGRRVQVGSEPASARVRFEPVSACANTHVPWPLLEGVVGRSSPWPSILRSGGWMVTAERVMLTCMLGVIAEPAGCTCLSSYDSLSVGVSGRFKNRCG